MNLNVTNSICGAIEIWGTSYSTALVGAAEVASRQSQMIFRIEFVGSAKVTQIETTEFVDTK